MTRVSNASSNHRARIASTLDRPRAAAARTKKPYKIVLEAVTQEKRKLQSIISYHDQPPSGFGYIPVGHPEFTEWCKEQCRQRNLDVHIVSAKPRNKAHADPDKISHHVHRIGHHFPLEIIELACKKFGYKFDEHRGLEKDKSGPTYGEAYFERGFAEYQQRQRLHGRPAVETETKDHVRGAVREMFPKIPDADLTSIINHAFQEGTGRVGNAKELSLARRVQLAVVAHIRHTYTDYDLILKQGTWQEARQKVEHVSLAKLKEWRDEAGETSHELEETFREVIVLDDEESSDDDTPPGLEREPSMEIVHSRATAHDLQPEPIDNSRGHVSYGGRTSRRTIVLQPVSAIPRSYVPNSSVAHPALQTSRRDPRAVPLAVVPEPPGLRSEPLPLYGRRVESSVREPIVRDLIPMQIRGSDGRLYNLQPVDEPRRVEQLRSIHSPPRLVHSGPASYRSPQPHYPPRPDTHYRDISRPSMPRGFVREAYEPFPAQRRSVSDQASRPPLAPSRRASDQDVVLPSIEREPDGVSSPRRVADASLHSRQDESSAALKYADVQSPKRKGFPTSMQHLQDRNFNSVPPVAKRPRHVYDDEEASVQLRPARAAMPPADQFQPAGSSSRPRVQADHELIDLTSSPTRMPYNGGRVHYEMLHRRPISRPSSRAYALAPSHEGDVRAVYNESLLRGTSRASIPGSERLYSGQTNRLDHATFREEAPPLPLEGDLYYGRHKLH